MNIIEDAISTGDHALAEARLACQTAAILNIFCPICGSATDQQEIHILEAQRLSDEQVIKEDIMCAICYRSQAASNRSLAEFARDAEMDREFYLTNWHGRERL